VRRFNQRIENARCWSPTPMDTDKIKINPRRACAM
jgi:hypothetical protein